MRSLAQRLIAEEHRLGGSVAVDGPAAFRVCNKLHGSLSILVGTRGFRTLLVRALALAKGEAPWLDRLEIGANGTVVFPAELEQEMEPKEVAKGGAALVARLLELLESLVGEAMTRRLVQQAWPKAALSDSESGGKT
jgi:hypothetical protein